MGEIAFGLRHGFKDQAHVDAPLGRGPQGIHDGSDLVGREADHYQRPLRLFDHLGEHGTRRSNGHLVAGGTRPHDRYLFLATHIVHGIASGSHSQRHPCTSEV